MFTLILYCVFLCVDVNATNHSLFPKIEQANIIYDVVGKSDILLNCRNITRTSLLPEIEMKLLPRSWTGINDEIYQENGLLIDPVLFASRYDAVQCRWKGSPWGTPVDIEHVLDVYHKLKCQTNETYHIDIEMINETTVRCVLTHADNLGGCPGVKSLMFANNSCVDVECTYDDHDVTLTLYDQDLTENNTAYECYASLKTTNSQSLSRIRTVKEMKTIADCGFSNHKPVILQHTFKSGAVQLTCRYPLNIGDIKHCHSGIKKATIMIEVKKLGTKNIKLEERWKKPVLWINYTLQSDGAMRVYANGDEVEFVQFYGFTLPNKNVMVVFVERELFDTLTKFGAVGTSVYTHCSFVYHDNVAYSRTIELTDATIKAYQRAKNNRRHPMLIDKSVVVYPPKFKFSWNQEYRATFVLKLIMGAFAVLAIFTILIATITAPRYKMRHEHTF